MVIRGDWRSAGGTHVARSATGHSLRPGTLNGRREASAVYVLPLGQNLGLGVQVEGENLGVGVQVESENLWAGVQVEG